jgi:hypothetical protein
MRRSAPSSSRRGSIRGATVPRSREGEARSPPQSPISDEDAMTRRATTPPFCEADCGRLPRHTRFGKARSGNTGGRKHGMTTGARQGACAQGGVVHAMTAPSVTMIRRALATFGAFALAVGAGCVPCSAAAAVFAQSIDIAGRGDAGRAVSGDGFFRLPAYFPASVGNGGPAEMPHVMQGCDEKCTLTPLRYKQVAFCREGQIPRTPAPPEPTKA